MIPLTTRTLWTLTTKSLIPVHYIRIRTVESGLKSALPVNRDVVWLSMRQPSKYANFKLLQVAIRPLIMDTSPLPAANHKRPLKISWCSIQIFNTLCCTIKNKLWLPIVNEGKRFWDHKWTFWINFPGFSFIKHLKKKKILNFLLNSKFAKLNSGFPVIWGKTPAF